MIIVNILIFIFYFYSEGVKRRIHIKNIEDYLLILLLKILFYCYCIYENYLLVLDKLFLSPTNIFTFFKILLSYKSYL